MKSVNKVILLGTIGHDPEVRYVAGNSIPVTSIRLVTDERYKDEQGNWQSRPEWHSVKAWRRQAEIIGQYVKKGDRLYIEGKLQTSSWTDQKAGEKKYRTEVIADDVVLLGGRRIDTAEESPVSIPEEVNHQNSATDPEIPF